LRRREYIDNQTRAGDKRLQDTLYPGKGSTQFQVSLSQKKTKIQRKIKNVPKTKKGEKNLRVKVTDHTPNRKNLKGRPMKKKGAREKKNHQKQREKNRGGAGKR